MNFFINFVMPTLYYLFILHVFNSIFIASHAHLNYTLNNFGIF